MVHNLYRFYLYAIFIALLIFAAIAIGQLLNTILVLTPLRGSSTSLPTSAQVVQAIVFAIISLVIAGTLGGIHYWLIRRDMLHHPEAVGSAIRAFFLNVTEAIGIILAVPVIGYLVFNSLAQNYGANVVNALALALPALGIVLLLELERRRLHVPVSSRAALAFQRFHFYGVQILLLFFLTFSLLSAFRPFVDGLIFNNRGIAQDCSNGDCQSYNLAYLAVSMLWFLVCWVGYGLLTRNDRSPLPRLVLHGASFAYGIGWILAGVYQGLELIISPFFKLSVSLHDVLGLSAQYDFVTPLALGLLVAGIYHLWLHDTVQQGLISQKGMALTEYAIVTVLVAALFWWGCGTALYNLLQTLAPAPSVPDNEAWISSIAFIVAGLGYIALDLYLHRHNSTDTSAAGPRRGLTLALFGTGILALAIGGATALYAWVTALFGTSISNWQQVTHGGLAAFLVGALLVGLYQRNIRKESLFSSPAKQPATSIAPTTPIAPATPVPTEPTASAEKEIEEVLDALLAGSITRDEAAKRLRTLSVISADNS